MSAEYDMSGLTIKGVAYCVATAGQIFAQITEREPIGE